MGELIITTVDSCNLEKGTKNCGRVLVLKKGIDDFALLKKIRHPGKVDEYFFGSQLFATEPWVLIASTSRNDTIGSKVFVFKYIEGPDNIKLVQTLYPPFQGSTSFGTSLSQSRELIAVGIPMLTSLSLPHNHGGVAVYDIESHRRWGKRPFLIQPSGLIQNEQFGKSVFLHDQNLAVSNQCDDTCSALYIFKVHRNNVLFQQKIHGPDIRQFVGSVIFDDTRLFLLLAPDAENIQMGSIMIFKATDGGQYELEQTIGSTPGSSNLGSHMCMFRRQILITSSVCGETSSCEGLGTIFGLRRIQQSWALVHVIAHDREISNDRYGSSLACGGLFFVVGAPQSGSIVGGAGAIHIYENLSV
eukprot:TRINITY_DN998_c0_g1_i4.p1 TRINITY_DN998_c0_g1~~TRINITY_DN998_c0_g1_i4.p1  ORF type:complete len:359 (+),score=35.91 TRINITY_DN998_c0_g1_i4:215-1291(+)